MHHSEPGLLISQPDHNMTHPLNTKNGLTLTSTFFLSVAEPAESSDSGVDANSVSSCELSSLQSETQKDSFNNLQCVDYLRNGKENFPGLSSSSAECLDMYIIIRKSKFL